MHGLHCKREWGVGRGRSRTGEGEYMGKEKIGPTGNVETTQISGPDRAGEGAHSLVDGLCLLLDGSLLPLGGDGRLLWGQLGDGSTAGLRDGLADRCLLLGLEDGDSVG